MDNNIFALLQMMKTSNNPQMFLSNMLKEKSGSNPMLNNVLSMMQNGNSKGIEQIARNMCREKGINPDEMISMIQKMK